MCQNLTIVEIILAKTWKNQRSIGGGKFMDFQRFAQQKKLQRFLGMSDAK